MFIVKLGGSVITDKAKKCFFKQEVMDRLSLEIKKAGKKLILIHGAGSFGHIPAKKYRLNQGYIDQNQIRGFSLTHIMVQELNTMVLKSLQSQGLPAVSIPPHAILKLSDRRPIKTDLHMFRSYLNKHFLPVTFGDVVLDEKLGFSICSGDILLQILVEYFRPEKAVFVIDEDGLYSSNPKIDKNAVFIENAGIKDLKNLTTILDSHADVTQGMSGKIEVIKKIASLGVDTVLLNGNKNNRLYNILTGKNTKHTLIHGRIKTV
ncbi:kinase [Euryarchaeota archaeon ex4484_162]|nr:MAG: kinase [Euryarchaeota archaeon ex4484_162]RLF30005.1 MAG: kinase [Thermoplasmata archaeon]